MRLTLQYWIFSYHESSVADSGQNPSEPHFEDRPQRMLKPGKQFKDRSPENLQGKQ